jgi:hypothetical protein
MEDALLTEHQEEAPRDTTSFGHIISQAKCQVLVRVSTGSFVED